MTPLTQAEVSWITTLSWVPWWGWETEQQILVGEEGEGALGTWSVQRVCGGMGGSSHPYVMDTLTCYFLEHQYMIVYSLLIPWSDFKLGTFLRLLEDLPLSLTVVVAGFVFCWRPLRLCGKADIKEGVLPRVAEIIPRRWLPIAAVATASRMWDCVSKQTGGRGPQPHCLDVSGGSAPHFS